MSAAFIPTIGAPSNYNREHSRQQIRQRRKPRNHAGVMFRHARKTAQHQWHPKIHYVDANLYRDIHKYQQPDNREPEGIGKRMVLRRSIAGAIHLKLAYKPLPLLSLKPLSLSGA